MVQLNVANVITVGLISLVVMAAAKFALTKFGMGTSWL
jgi:hypothetical protein